MLTGLLWLLLCQLVGTLAVELTGAPIPGPVVGMALLFAALEVRRWRLVRAGTPSDELIDATGLARAADLLLRHLQLLFVPAGVGVVAYVALIGRNAVPLVIGLVGSWLLALVVVGWTAQLLTRQEAR